MRVLKLQLNGEGQKVTIDATQWSEWISNELDQLDNGEFLKIEVGEMNKKEFEELQEFNGW